MVQQATVIRPTSRQIQAKQAAAANFITLFGGAVRGGKSYWLILVLYSYAVQYPKSRWCLLRCSMAIIRSTLLVTFQKLTGEGLGGYIQSFNRTEMVVTLKNGSQIIFFGENIDDDPELERFRGLEVNGFGIDEISEIQEATLTKCIERAGSWQGSPGCPNKILATCNPTQGWVKEKFYDNWKAGTMPKNHAYVPSKITDNPHISEEYKETLKLLPKYEYEVFVEGNWDIQRKTGGEAYKNFDPNTQFVDWIEYNPMLPIHMTWDFNTNPYVTCLLWQIEGKKAMQFEEILLSSPRNTNMAVCSEFERKFPAHTAGLFIYGDPGGLKLSTADETNVRVKEKDYSEFAGIEKKLSKYRPSRRVARVYPAVKLRIDFANTIFESKFEDIEIYFSNKCKATLAEYTNLKEASDGTKHKETYKHPETQVPCQKWGHISDANDYLWTSAFKDEFHKYQHGEKIGKAYTGPPSKNKGQW